MSRASSDDGVHVRRDVAEGRQRRRLAPSGPAERADAAGALQQGSCRSHGEVILDATGHLAGILSMDDIVLRALDQPGGVSSAAFTNAITRICSQPSVEPEVHFSDTFISG
jgi:hypothetical protein